MLQRNENPSRFGRAPIAALVLGALLVPQAAGAQTLSSRDIACKYRVTKTVVRAAFYFMRARADCLEQQAKGALPAGTNCLENPPELGGAGTGAPNIDARLNKAAEKGTRRSQRIGRKCDTPLRTPQTIGMDTLCNPASNDWNTVLQCANDLGRNLARELTAYAYDPAIGTLGDDELKCRLGIAEAFRKAALRRIRRRSDCFKQNDKGNTYNCMATVAYPGRVVSTGFAKVDRKLKEQLVNFHRTITESCGTGFDLSVFTSNPRISDYTVSGGFGGAAFTVEDLFQVLLDALLSQASNAVATMFPGLARCGNGIREPGEQCDDGNRMSCDGGCDRDCTLSICGNGAACGPYETCDDGNLVENDGCSSLCMLEGCGDGILQRELGEGCDDGNLVDCDACDSNCTPSVNCNNGVVCPSEGEQCDLGVGTCIGGFNDLDACIYESDCPGICTAGDVGQPCSSNADCGPVSEGLCEPALGCGGRCDGGANNHGLCLTSSDCPGTCAAASGAGASCASSADCVPGLECNNAGVCVLPADGDPCFSDGDCGTGGVCTLSNGCIAGNSDTRGDACRTDCTNPRCGDGTTDPNTDTNGLGGETCDDGNLFDGDGCDSNCTPTGCGNGIITPPEICDDGPGTCLGGLDNGSTCSSDNDCHGVCGSDFVTPCTLLTAVIDCGGAACINTGICAGGNSDTLPNACRSDCAPARCGDGVIDTGEQCDDGNTVAGDGCDPLCQIE